MLLWSSSHSKKSVMEPNPFALCPYVVKPFLEGSMVDDIVDDAVVVLAWKISHIKISTLHCRNS